MNLNKFFYTNFPEHYGKVNEFLETIYLPLKLLLFYLNFDIFLAVNPKINGLLRRFSIIKKMVIF